MQKTTERFPTNADVLKTKQYAGYTLPAVVDILDQHGWPVCTWRLSGHCSWIVTSHSDRFDRAFQSVFTNDYCTAVYDLLESVESMWTYQPQSVHFNLHNGRQGDRYSIVD